MNSINTIRARLFFDKTEIIIYILALFTFVLLILTFTQNKKRHLFKDQDLAKAHLLKSQYSESYKSNSEFIEDLSNSVSVNNKHLILNQPAMDSETISNSKGDRLVAKPLASQTEMMNKPDNEDSLSSTDSGDNARPNSEPMVNTKSVSPVMMPTKDRPGNDVKSKLTNNTPQPQDQIITGGNGSKIQPNQERSIDRYRVKKGDCMSSIANKHNISLLKLLRSNPMKNPNLIFIGSIINIPMST